MNICMLSELFYPYLLGGAERRYFEIAKRLAKNHDVTVYSLNLYGEKKEEIKDGVRIKRVGLKHPKTQRSLPQLATYFPALLRAVSKEYDIVDANQGIASYAGLLKKTTQRPVVATFHDIYWDKWKNHFGGHISFPGKVMEASWSKLSYSAIIANSKQTKEKLENLGVKSHIEIIFSGIDLGTIKSIKAKKENKIIFVGRLVKYKNVDILIRTFAEIKKDKKDLELVIVGEGPEKNNLYRLSKSLNVKVEFKGFLSEKEKIKEIKSSLVLVNPSSVEGLGLIILESMACGTIPVGLDLNCYDAFCKKNNSILVKKPVEIKEKIRSLLSENNRRKKLEKNGTRTAGNFSWDLTAEKVERLYNSVLDHK